VVRTANIFCGVVLIGFIIQLLGASLIDRNLTPLINSPPLIWKIIGYAGILLGRRDRAIPPFSPILHPVRAPSPSCGAATSTTPATIN
jgi:hypothetical protein